MITALSPETTINVLLTLIGLLVGLAGGVEYARRATAKKVDKIDRESGEHGVQIKDLRKYVDAVNKSAEENHAMNIQILNIVNNTIAQNSAVIKQSQILFDKLMN